MVRGEEKLVRRFSIRWKASSSFRRGYPTRESASRRRRPLVLINRDTKGILRVLMDSGAGVAEAVDHLASLGHKRIAYIGGPKKSWSNAQRRAAVRAGRKSTICRSDHAGAEGSFQTGYFAATAFSTRRDGRGRLRRSDGAGRTGRPRRARRRSTRRISASSAATTCSARPPTRRCPGSRMLARRRPGRGFLGARRQPRDRRAARDGNPPRDPRLHGSAAGDEKAGTRLTAVLETGCTAVRHGPRCSRLSRETPQ